MSKPLLKCERCGAEAKTCTMVKLRGETEARWVNVCQGCMNLLKQDAGSFFNKGEWKKRGTAS